MDQMQLYSYKLDFRIWHPSIDPQIVTETLGLEPTHFCMAGQPRKTPKGRLLGGIHAESYWSADPFKRGEYMSSDDAAEDAISAVLELLRPHKHFLLLLQGQGGRLVLQISSFSARNYAIVLPPDLLMEMAALGISWAHDVHPYAQSW
jgi:hypothetical protein